MASINLPSNPTVLVFRPDRIGDAVVSSGCLPALRARWPEGRIYYVVSGVVKPLFEGLDCLDGVLEAPAQGKGGHGFVEVLRKLGVDAAVHLQPSEVCCRACAVAGVPVRIGWDEEEVCLPHLTHAVKSTRLLGLEHEALCNFELLKPLGIEPPAKPRACLAPPPQGRDSLAAKLPWDPRSTAYAVVHPSAAKPTKHWLPERFAEVARGLARERGLRIISVGGSREDAACRAFAEAFEEAGASDGESEGGLVRLEGRLSLVELCGLYERARLQLTSDSGPAHIAAAMECPQVVLFGRVEPIFGPVRWRPLSDEAELVISTARKRWYEPKPWYWRRSWRSIHTGQVRETVESLLALLEKRDSEQG